MLLFLALLCAGGAIYLFSEVATYPARLKARSIKRATDYGRIRIRSDERELSFRIPDGIKQADLLAEGWAIDGHSALYGVAAHTEDVTGRWVSMAEELLDTQRYVVKFLGDKGFEVRFR